MLEVKQTLKAAANKKKSWLKYGIVLALLVCVGGGFWWFMNLPPTISYTTAKPTIQDLQSTISASGTLAPTNEVKLGSIVSGIVLEVFVDVNDRVHRGQILAQIDPESIQQQLDRYHAQLTSAKAQLASAEAQLVAKDWEYQKYLALFEKSGGKVPSELELQTTKSNFLVAQADIEMRKASIAEIETNIKSTEIDLKNTQIISPINGVVLSRSIEVGESVAASFQAPEFFTIAESLEEMELKVKVSEADIGKVKEGQKVVFTVDAYPLREFEARVDRVNYGSNAYESSSSASSSDTIVSYETRIFIQNSDLVLRPGMSATAEIQVAEANNALSIPVAALYYKPQDIEGAKAQGGFNILGGMRKPPKGITTLSAKTQDDSLWILQDGAPHKVPITTGLNNGKFVQILSGIDSQHDVILSQSIEQ
ncbi:MAG: efflux RND transporter periplasmic adaptor subunit [Helicobacter sp.]|nr:efflux RND transporter periplasmic adaptor subunit [Helicobacter sp.]